VIVRVCVYGRLLRLIKNKQWLYKGGLQQHNVRNTTAQHLQKAAPINSKPHYKFSSMLHHEQVFEILPHT